MKINPQNTIFDRLFFFGYHIVVAIGSVFALNYYSLPQPDFQSALMRMASMSVEPQVAGPVVEKSFVISGMTGEVKIHEDEFSGSDRPAVENEILKEGFIVDTDERSSAILKFGHGFKCQIRIYPGSKIRIEKLFTPRMEGEARFESTLVSVSTGEIMVQIEEQSPNSSIEFKTAHARFSPKSGLSGISTDGKSYSFLAVKSGEVRAENTKTLKFEVIPMKQSFFVDEKGRERVSQMPEALGLFIWDLAKTETKLMNLDILMASTGGPFVETAEQKLDAVGMTPEELAKLEGQITEEMRNYQIYTAKLHEEIQVEQNSLQDQRKRQDKENLKIQADINCLEVEKQCDLYSEKLLLSRGFPRIHNSARMATSIITDLTKYQNEETEKLNVKQKEVEELVLLEQKRKENWTWIQSRIADKSVYREILSKLQDQTFTK